MIDLHTHLLAGLDDGPATLAESVALARATVASGVHAVAATPHVSAAHPNAPGPVRAAVLALREALSRERVPLAVVPGAEVTLERAVALPDADLRRLRLGHGRFLLLECPLSASAGDPQPIVEAVQRRGHGVLLAHPERSPCFQRDPSQVERLVAGGALTSVTAGAVAGRFGEPPRRLALQLLEAGLVHDLASDMHDLRGRPPGLRSALGPVAGALCGLEASLDWLTRDMPQAILGGGPLPPAPAVAIRPRRPAGRRPRLTLARRRP